MRAAAPVSLPRVASLPTWSSPAHVPAAPATKSTHSSLFISSLFPLPLPSSLERHVPREAEVFRYSVFSCFILVCNDAEKILYI